MKKAVDAIILVVLALFLVKTCAVWKYEATEATASEETPSRTS